MKKFIEVAKTEKEQSEQVKTWIKNNIGQIIAGVVLGLGAIWGFDFYQQHQQENAIQARQLYLNVFENPQNNTAFNQLKQDHADSQYLNQAILILAKNAVSNKNHTKALEYLTPISTDENNTFVAKVARMRIASIHLQMKQFKQALEILDTPLDDKFNALFNHLKGDIYLTDNQINKAKKHYQLALKQLPNNSLLKNLIQIKLNDLN